MLCYNKIDVSEGIYINTSNKSKECIICHYSYFLDLPKFRQILLHWGYELIENDLL